MDLDFFKEPRKLLGEPLEKIENEDFQNELSNKLKEMEERFTIDRFEGDYAICENRQTGEMVEIEKEKLPDGIKEGTIIKKENDIYVEDLEETENVAKRIKEKMDNLWND